MTSLERSKWAEALESGEYKQGTMHLNWRTADGDDIYCCLGVLNALEIVPRTTMDEYPQLVCSSKLNDDLLDMFVKLNDDQGMTFEDIAKVVRACNLLLQ